MTVNLIWGYVLPFVLLVVAIYFIKTYRDERVAKWVDIAVRAAEQIFEHGENEEKFKHVFEGLSKKFKIPKEELKNLIESSVYQLNLEQSEDK